MPSLQNDTMSTEPGVVWAGAGGRPALHFIGICGKAMGGIAAALARDGWRVTGSDQDVYPPMSGHLAESGIRVLTPYDARNVPEEAALVIVGKRVAADNPELLHVIRRDLPRCSFPQFLGEHFLSRSRNAVVAGGIGKTTTTAMLAWILEHWQLRPDYLIGGLARNFGPPARFSGGALAVLEGDEYASCFDDGGPKFLHYRPEVAAITNVIEDHPDVFRNLDELCGAFAALIRLLPSGGCLIVPEADATAARLARDAPCPVIAVGYGSAATDRITGERLFRDRSCFRLRGADFEIPLCGRMNVTNAAMAALAAGHFGIGPARAAEALSRFAGVVNRQEERQIGGIVLVRDKASHPRALVELACAMRQRFPGRRLLSVIQPRATGGRDWIYQRDLPAALAGFDEVILSGSYEHKPQQRPAWAADPFCQDLLATGLKSLGIEVSVARDAMDLRSSVAGRARGGDVVVLTVLEQAGILVDAVVAGLREGGASAEPSRAPLPQPFGRAL